MDTAVGNLGCFKLPRRGGDDWAGQKVRVDALESIVVRSVLYNELLAKIQGRGSVYPNGLPLIPILQTALPAFRK